MPRTSSSRSNRVRTAALLAVALWSACSRPPPEAGQPAPPSREKDVVSLDPSAFELGRIAVAEVRTAALPELLRVTGRIGVDENRSVRVGAVADGRVVHVFSNVGDLVRQGQRLAEIHSHEVHEARSDLAKARAELERRQAELDFARAVRNRASRLHELKAGSLEQVQRAETEFRHAETAVAGAEAELARAAEHLHHLGLPASGPAAEANGTRSATAGAAEIDELIPILAPITGTVLERKISPGAVVNPATDLFVISDLTSLWVHAEVPERYLASLKVGRPVQFSVQAYGDRRFAGRISRIGDVLDPDTRTVHVRCQTDNSADKLKPEMYATVTFDLGKASEAVLVPTEAVQDVGGYSVVFVRETENRFRAHRIRPGRQADSQTEVLEGLRPGQTIVTSGSFLLKSELLKSQMAAE